MSKLDELRQLVADAFKEAESKESIETLATINKTIEEAQVEEQSLMDKNAELIKSYKDLIQHTSFRDDKKPSDTVPGAIGMPTFEEALQNFMSKQQ